MTARGAHDLARISQKNDFYALNLDWPKALALGAVDIEIGRIKRRSASDKQPIAGSASKTQIGDHFGNEYFSDQRAICIIAMHAIRRRAPKPARSVKAKSIEQACAAFGEDRAFAQCLPVFAKAKFANMFRPVFRM
jgi:hypothetical protein